MSIETAKISCNSSIGLNQGHYVCVLLSCSSLVGYLFICYNEEFMKVYLGPESISDLSTGTLVHGQWTSVRY